MVLTEIEVVIDGRIDVLEVDEYDVIQSGKFKGMLLADFISDIYDHPLVEAIRRKE